MHHGKALVFAKVPRCYLDAGWRLTGLVLVAVGQGYDLPYHLGIETHVHHVLVAPVLLDVCRDHRDQQTVGAECLGPTGLPFDRRWALLASGLSNSRPLGGILKTFPEVISVSSQTLTNFGAAIASLGFVRVAGVRILIGSVRDLVQTELVHLSAYNMWLRRS